MSKTFKTARADNKVLNVDNLFGNPRLLIKEFDGDTRGFVFAPSDAPALALAILEAAGAHKDSQDFLGGAVEQLKFHIAEQERATAEAKEQAELEAEALELRNAYMNQIGRTNVAWDDMSEEQQEIWLAVARRAREMRAEK